MTISRIDIIFANAELRRKDESHLWPARGRYNVTNRAIRRVRALIRDGLVVENVESYKAIVESVISEIVNDSRNW